MTTFSRFCDYVDAMRKARPSLPNGATYGQVVDGLARAGFLGTTAGELQSLSRHMRGFTQTRQERTLLMSETIELIRKYGIGGPGLGAAELTPVVPVDDLRGQTVLHDLRQFEDDMAESARRLGKAVPSLDRWDVDPTAENAFAWVYALQAGMLD